MRRKTLPCMSRAFIYTRTCAVEDKHLGCLVASALEAGKEEAMGRQATQQPSDIRMAVTKKMGNIFCLSLHGATE